MKTESTYQPPFSITPLVLRKIADISEAVGRISWTLLACVTASPLLAAGLLRLWRLA